MIVEPTPTTPRSPIGRALRAVGLATPLLLLAAVAGFGLLGPRTEPPIADPSAATSASPAASAANPPPIPDRPAPDFPATAAGLPVRSVIEAEPRLAAATGSVVAVAGWLGSLVTDDACVTGESDTRGLLSPLCTRRARLTVADPRAADRAAHLHVLVPPGVRLPPVFEASGAASVAPVAVVIVGHADASGSDCVGSNRGCAERFTADLVTWADGAPFEPGVLFDAGLLDPGPAIAYRNRDIAEAYAAGPGGTILVAAVLRPATVAAVDPDAAAALATAPSPTDLVWYVRALVGPGNERGMRWGVVDHVTGALLASGGVPAEDFPPLVAGLRVRSVQDTIDASRAGTLPGVVAIAGYLRAWVEPGACARPIAGLPANGCQRKAILALEAFGGGEPGSGDLGTNLHALVPPGVVVPDPAVGAPGSIDAQAPRVVVIARVGSPPGSCPAGGGVTGGASCEAFFALERVAWISGRPLGLDPQLAGDVRVARNDRIARDHDAASRRVLGDGITPLRTVLARARDLVAIDPEARTAVRGATRPREPVWYLRGLDPDGTIEWAVVVAKGGRVLASGTAR